MKNLIIGTVAAFGLMSASVATAAPAQTARTAATPASLVPAGHSVLATADVKDGDHIAPLLLILVIFAVVGGAVVAVDQLSGSGGI